MSGKCPSLPTGSPKKCIVTFHTQNDRMNEPPPQPRVRKVTTIVNTMGVVVRNTDSELVVWVLTACVETVIPKGNKQHMFVDFHLGTWIIIGIYPDSTVSSYSPWPLILKSFETRVVNGSVQIKRRYSDFNNNTRYSDIAHLEVYTIPGFGRVMGSSITRLTLDDMRETSTCWLQYCGGLTKEISWFVIQADGADPEEMGLKDNDLRNISAFIRDRSHRLQNDFEPCPDKSVVRHFGLITEVFENKKLLQFWSPKFSLEIDPIAKIPHLPKNREVECEMLLPLIGQWVQYDIQPIKDEIEFKTKSSQRLNIQEYLPINSPGGIGVVFSKRTVRVMISCILVKSTDHPMLYELPLFGFVVDWKSSLVSGSHMQIVLEKIQKQRRVDGLFWRVIDSLVVKESDVTIEKIKEVLVENIPLKDAMEISKFIPIEKLLSSHQKPAPLNISIGAPPSSAITNLKYQHVPPHNHFNDQRRDYYTGNNIHVSASHTSTRNSRHPSKQKQHPFEENNKMEGHAIIERVLSNNKTGILWFFERNQSVHFIYEDFDLSVGDYAFVRLEKKTDPLAALGFRWLWKSGTKKTAPFTCHVDNTQIYIEDQLVYGGLDAQNRHFYRSSNFPTVFDVDGVITAPQAGVWYYVTLFRRKIVNTMSNQPAFRYHWAIFNVQHVVPMKNYYPTSTQYHRSYAGRQSLISNHATPASENARSTAYSDVSSKSPPPKSLTPPSDG